MRTAERTADEKLKNARALASYSLPPYPSLLKLKSARARSARTIFPMNERASADAADSEREAENTTTKTDLPREATTSGELECRL